MAPSDAGRDRTRAGGLLLRFAVIGDFGAGTSAQQAIARRMCAVHDRRRFPIVLTTGDNIYPSGQPSLFERHFFTPFACLFRRGVRWHASLGNHDVATAEGQPQVREPAFGMRGDHYVLRRNSVRFVVANSNALDGGWLQRALRSPPPDRWTIVVFHHPVYSPGPHGSTPALSLQLPSLLRRWGVDLVLNGHDHLYSVTKPLGGIRYVVTGGGGAALYDCSPVWFVDVCLEEHHFLLVDALADRLAVRAIGMTGEVLHSFSTPGTVQG